MVSSKIGLIGIFQFFIGLAGEISWRRIGIIRWTDDTVAILLSRSRNCFRSRVETCVCLTERGSKRAIRLRVDEKTSFSRRAYLLAARTSFEEWNNPVTRDPSTVGNRATVPCIRGTGQVLSNSINLLCISNENRSNVDRYRLYGWYRVYA